MYIKRNIEDVLLRRAKNSRCILVTGARQVGKSTLLKICLYDSKLYLADNLVVLPIEYI